jgi:hypothetical protein
MEREGRAGGATDHGGRSLGLQPMTVRPAGFEPGEAILSPEPNPPSGHADPNENRQTDDDLADPDAQWAMVVAVVDRPDPRLGEENVQPAPPLPGVAAIDPTKHGSGRTTFRPVASKVRLRCRDGY